MHIMPANMFGSGIAQRQYFHQFHLFFDILKAFGGSSEFGKYAPFKNISKPPGSNWCFTSLLRYAQLPGCTARHRHLQLQLGQLVLERLWGLQNLTNQETSAKSMQNRYFHCQGHPQNHGLRTKCDHSWFMIGYAHVWNYPRFR